jgi:transcriptional regulator with XRE-family HTH domain
MPVKMCEWIRQARLARGWSQAELSRRSHIPSAMLSRYESGSNRPRADALFSIAEALGLDDEQMRQLIRRETIVIPPQSSTRNLLADLEASLTSRDERVLAAITAAVDEALSNDPAIQSALKARGTDQSTPLAQWWEAWSERFRKRLVADVAERLKET